MFFIVIGSWEQPLFVNESGLSRPPRSTDTTPQAQLVEFATGKTDFDSEGREFESLRARQ